MAIKITVKDNSMGVVGKEGFIFPCLLDSS